MSVQPNVSEGESGVQARLWSIQSGTCAIGERAVEVGASPSVGDTAWVKATGREASVVSGHVQVCSWPQRTPPGR